MSGCGLSGLPDDLLRRVLYFAPAKEAASTAVLSRRWRSLWRTSGAINLDSRSYDRSHGNDLREKVQAFSRGMAAALASAAAAAFPVTRLTLHVVEERFYEMHFLTNFGSRPGHEHDIVTALIASPAASAAEDIRVVIDRYTDMFGSKLAFGSLPSETLRTLHVANVTNLTPPPGAAVFPRLADLRLRRCGVTLAELQLIVDAAPQLATLHLECYSFGATMNIFYRLVCPAVTALVILDCSWPGEEEGGLELDVPSLQHFRYRGHVELASRLSLKLSEAPNIIRVDLHFVPSGYRNEQIRVSAFWEFIQRFNVAKVLKLKLDFETHHVAVDEEHDELCLRDKLFYNLQQLDLEIPSEPESSSTSALFIANLLRCCPVVRDLRLKVTTTKASKANRRVIQDRSDFDKSMGHFRHRKRAKIVPGGHDDEEDYEVSDIPGLSGHSFECLRSYLRTVSLQFWMEEPTNCFGVQLARFFAENAVVLKEISVDDGNHKLSEHMNRMLARWIPSASKRKNSPAFRESYPRKRQKR